MACKPPGTTCQETKPTNTKDGTSALCSSPVPGVSRGPEAVSDEIGASYLPVKTRLCLDGAQMQVLAALRAYQGEIVAAEKKFRIDRLAIAGAIAWEMLENPPGRIRRTARAVMPIPRSVGWGKVHLYNLSKSGAFWGGLSKGFLGAVGGAFDFDTIAQETEDAGYLPKLSFNDRKNALATPEGAITYIAGIMAAIADLAARYGFDDTRSDPATLTNVFQGDTLKSWEEKLRKKPKGAPFVAGNEMALWVGRNMTFLQDAVGTPDLPESQPGFSVAPTTASPAAAKAASSKLDKDKVAQWMDDHAEKGSQGLCARYCRQGLEAGGLNTEGHPISAKDYGPFLTKRGATVVSPDNYIPQKGDLVVFDGNEYYPDGHLQVYDGSQWVSDFKQNRYSPYTDKTTPPSTIYRFP